MELKSARPGARNAGGARKKAISPLFGSSPGSCWSGEKGMVSSRKAEEDECSRRLIWPGNEARGEGTVRANAPGHASTAAAVLRPTASRRRRQRLAPRRSPLLPGPALVPSTQGTSGLLHAALGPETRYRCRRIRSSPLRQGAALEGQCTMRAHAQSAQSPRSSGQSLGNSGYGGCERGSSP